MAANPLHLPFNCWSAAALAKTFTLSTVVIPWDTHCRYAPSEDYVGPKCNTTHAWAGSSTSGYLQHMWNAPTMLFNSIGTNDCSHRVRCLYSGSSQYKWSMQTRTGIAVAGNVAPSNRTKFCTHVPKTFKFGEQHRGRVAGMNPIDPWRLPYTCKSTSAKLLILTPENDVSKNL